MPGGRHLRSRLGHMCAPVRAVSRLHNLPPEQRSPEAHRFRVHRPYCAPEPRMNSESVDRRRFLGTISSSNTFVMLARGKCLRSRYASTLGEGILLKPVWTGTLVPTGRLVKGGARRAGARASRGMGESRWQR